MASTQLIHDATIVTVDQAGSILYGAALAVSDGRIAALGPTPELLVKYPDAERVDGRGRAVLPGFANTHTHLSRVLARGIYEDLSPPHTPPFTGGLAPLPLPPLSRDEERVMALLGALEAIRSGTTLVLEESAGLDGYAGALLDTGLRLVLCERAWDRANASIGQPGAFQVDPALAEAGLARIADFHTRWNGKGDGRLAQLERAGCLVTLGTDNMAEDMVEVVRTAMFMERVRRRDGRHPTPEDALAWATRNGYRALGIPDGGWLAPGNRADLILIDLRKPHLTPALRVVSCFVHQGLASDVEAVMVDGRWIMRAGRVLTLDEPSIVAEADRIARAAWRRLFERRPDMPRPPGFDLGPR